MENELEAPARVVERLSGKTGRRRTIVYSHTETEQLSRWMSRFWDVLSENRRLLAYDNDSVVNPQISNL